MYKRINRFRNIAVMLMAATFLFCSCNKNDTSNNGNTDTDIVQGKWSVVYYAANGNDETAHYTGYQFAFTQAGAIAAANDTATVNGAWSTTIEENKNRLILSFGTAVPFNELTNDWQVMQHSSSIITLKDVSGSGGTDSLVFKKI